MPGLREASINETITDSLLSCVSCKRIFVAYFQGTPIRDTDFSSLYNISTDEVVSNLGLATKSNLLRNFDALVGNNIILKNALFINFCLQSNNNSVNYPFMYYLKYHTKKTNNAATSISQKYNCLLQAKANEQGKKRRSAFNSIEKLPAVCYNYSITLIKFFSSDGKL